MHCLKSHLSVRTAATFALALFLSAAARAQDQPARSAAFAVMDSASGYILRAANADAKLQVGSLTKIATAMVVLDWLELTKHSADDTATVPPEAATLGGQNPVGFQPGDQATLRDLLYAALLQSDNIAALTLATHVGRQLKAPQPRARTSPPPKSASLRR